MVELQALGVVSSLVTGQHGETGSISLVQALGCRGGALQLGAAGLSREANLHVLKLRQTPALQLTDQRRLLKGRIRPQKESL